MKLLDVPLIHQPIGSVDCIPTCVLMVLNYYGITEDLENLKKQLFYTEIGTTIYDNGVLLLEKGLTPTAVTAQPRLFPGDLISQIKDNKDIEKIISDKKQDTNTDSNQKLILDTMTKYIDSNGKFLIEIPSKRHVIKSIDEGAPLIALGYAQAIGLNEGTYHAVVVNGYKDGYVHINNPWKSSLGSSWVKDEEFFYFIHSSTCVDMDNGTLMIVKNN